MYNITIGFSGLWFNVASTKGRVAEVLLLMHTAPASKLMHTLCSFVLRRVLLKKDFFLFWDDCYTIILFVGIHRF